MKLTPRLSDAINTYHDSTHRERILLETKLVKWVDDLKQSIKTEFELLKELVEGREDMHPYERYFVIEKINEALASLGDFFNEDWGLNKE